MLHRALSILVASASLVSPITAAESPTRLRFLVTGLHCPPCTRTVESSLTRLEGVRSVSVDWKTKNAVVEIDESLVSVQEVLQHIAGTPHMMGRGMRYAGWLAMKVPAVSDPAAADRVKNTAKAVAGVDQVVVYPKQQSIAVSFKQNGKTTTAWLLQSLRDAGLEVELLQ